MIHSKVESLWSSLLTFRVNEEANDISKYQGRGAPAIFYNKAGYLYFKTISSNAFNWKNLNFKYDIELDKLYHIDIVQEEKDGKVGISRLDLIYLA